MRWEVSYDEGEIPTIQSRVQASPNELDALGQTIDHLNRNGDALRVDDTDGYSFEFAEWRFNIRRSNTEPVVRLNVESRGDVPLLEAKTAEVLAIVEL